MKLFEYLTWRDWLVILLLAIILFMFEIIFVSLIASFLSNVL